MRNIIQNIRSFLSKKGKRLGDDVYKLYNYLFLINDAVTPSIIIRRGNQNVASVKIKDGWSIINVKGSKRTLKFGYENAKNLIYDIIDGLIGTGYEVNMTEIKNIQEDMDGEYALNKLREIRKFSNMLLSIIKENDDLPEWVMEKIVISANNLNESYQHIENKSLKHEGTMNNKKEKLKKIIREEIVNVIQEAKDLLTVRDVDKFISGKRIEVVDNPPGNLLLLEFYDGSMLEIDAREYSFDDKNISSIDLSRSIEGKTVSNAEGVSNTLVINFEDGSFMDAVDFSARGHQ